MAIILGNPAQVKAVTVVMSSSSDMFTDFAEIGVCTNVSAKVFGELE
jgi:hypothetical protein